MRRRRARHRWALPRHRPPPCTHLSATAQTAPPRPAGVRERARRSLSTMHRLRERRGLCTHAAAACSSSMQQQHAAGVAPCSATRRSALCVGRRHPGPARSAAQAADETGTAPPIETRRIQRMQDGKRKRSNLERQRGRVVIQRVGRVRVREELWQEHLRPRRDVSS